MHTDPFGLSVEWGHLLPRAIFERDKDLIALLRKSGLEGIHNKAKYGLVFEARHWGETHSAWNKEWVAWAKRMELRAQADQGFRVTEDMIGDCLKGLRKNDDYAEWLAKGFRTKLSYGQWQNIRPNRILKSLSEDRAKSFYRALEKLPKDQIVKRYGVKLKRRVAKKAGKQAAKKFPLATVAIAVVGVGFRVANGEELGPAVAKEAIQAVPIAGDAHAVAEAIEEIIREEMKRIEEAEQKRVLRILRGRRPLPPVLAQRGTMFPSAGVDYTTHFNRLMHEYSAYKPGHFPSRVADINRIDALALESVYGVLRKDWDDCSWTFRSAVFPPLEAVKESYKKASEIPVP